jgi:hypothetical protein
MPVDTPRSPTTTTTSPVPLTEFPLDTVLFAIDALGPPDELLLAREVQRLGYENATLLVFAAGADDLRAAAEDSYDRVDAPPLLGRPASYLVWPGTTDRAGIAVQWAAGAWADLFLESATEEELRTAATGLRADAAEPARFMFTVSAPPGLHLGIAEPYREGDEANTTNLVFAVDDGPLPEPFSPGGAVVQVTVGEYFDTYDGGPTPNTTLDGRPARVNDGIDSYSVELLDLDPYIVTVWVTGDARDVFSPQEANALALSVALVGTMDDRSQWTDEPLV